MKQINFTKLFFQQFQNKAKKRKYQLRFGTPQLLHDLAFLSSLIHDADFRIKDIKYKNNKVVIPIVRDCWEERYTKQEMGFTKSNLVLTGVNRITWEGLNKKKLTKSSLSIDYLFFSENYRSYSEDDFDFIIVGNNWKCSIGLTQDKSRVWLKDNKNKK